MMAVLNDTMLYFLMTSILQSDLQLKNYSILLYTQKNKIVTKMISEIKNKKHQFCALNFTNHTLKSAMSLKVKICISCFFNDDQYESAMKVCLIN